ncbi:antitoxin VbhA family protein [Desulfosporosinus nitroreducens]|uniref:antitoxin VbhA family protein n=1 Tax=Desulfosporosinus nitroreducens TaxID=2018668 RepID=UPI00207C17EA|nr:antitoxin VbhA family protein [Desulfosporosinus nitroreducens]MCO1604634.1 antitoxin VbhA family protein [Desulfosporosinus nitroreducens]
MGTQKDKAWDYALGIIKVDGLEPSPEFLELVEKEKRGEITTNDIIKTLNERYKMKKDRNGDDA